MERVGEWEERMYRENRERERDSQPLQRSHVIEGMVQLLADGLILQLLSVQFVWEVRRSAGSTKHRGQVQRQRITSRSRKRGDLEARQMDTKSVEREKKKKREMGERKRMMNGQMQERRDRSCVQIRDYSEPQNHRRFHSHTHTHTHKECSHLC